MAGKILRPGATAVITGGASGVGFAMAMLFRKHGMHICLLDNNDKHLARATSILSSQTSVATHPGIKTTSHALDVGNLDSWADVRSQILSDHPDIDVLMLNAGTSLKPSNEVSQTYDDPEYFSKTLQTNMFGVINGLTSLLSTVQKTSKMSSSSLSSTHEPTQAVIITGSKQGITNPPGALNPAYNMSKSALKTLAEHLAYDLRTPQNPSFTPGISVHLLIPGWTFTGLSGNAGPPNPDAPNKTPQGAWTPDQVANYAVEKINQRKFYIVCPDDDVDEALDQARMEWAIGDVVEGRPALSRWEDGWKDEAAKKIAENAEARRQQ